MNKKQCDKILKLLNDKGSWMILERVKTGRGSYRLIDNEFGYGFKVIIDEYFCIKVSDDSWSRAEDVLDLAEHLKALVETVDFVRRTCAK